MSYDLVSTAAFTASAKVRYYVPRAIGLWVYSISLFGLAIAFLGYRAYESGKLFREQFDYGYKYDQGVNNFLCPLTCALILDSTDESTESKAFLQQELNELYERTLEEIAEEFSEVEDALNNGKEFIEEIAEEFSEVESGRDKQQYSMSNTILELRQALKARGIKGYSRKTKAECLAIL